MFFVHEIVVSMDLVAVDKVVTQTELAPVLLELDVEEIVKLLDSDTVVTVVLVESLEKFVDVADLVRYFLMDG